MKFKFTVVFKNGLPSATFCNLMTLTFLLSLDHLPFCALMSEQSLLSSVTLYHAHTFLMAVQNYLEGSSSVFCQNWLLNHA